jgi:hypothetical protein
MKQFKANQVNRARGVALWWAGIAPIALCVYLFTPQPVSQAAGFSSPQECESSTGDAHLDCLYRYIDRQQKNTGSIEADVDEQREMIERIRDQGPPSSPDTSVAGDVQERSADRTDIAQPTAVPAHLSAITPGRGSPEECRAYTGDAHLNCLYAYIEIQRSKAGTVEEELKTQKHMLGQLRDQMDRQASASQDLQRRLAERDAPSSSSASIYIPPPIYPGYGYPGYLYPGYGYPPPGLSLYLGAPGFYYGRPFYGPRFFGPRFYGHRHR